MQKHTTHPTIKPRKLNLNMDVGSIIKCSSTIMGIWKSCTRATPNDLCFNWREYNKSLYISKIVTIRDDIDIICVDVDHYGTLYYLFLLSSVQIIRNCFYISSRHFGSPELNLTFSEECLHLYVLDKNCDKGNSKIDAIF